jgi:hypothetical protein
LDQPMGQHDGLTAVVSGLWLVSCERNELLLFSLVTSH